MNNYNEIKQNIIDKFFNKIYRNSICSCKNSIISDIKERCPFNVDILDNDYTILKMVLGNNIILTFNFEWEIKRYTNSTKIEIESYKLIKIS